MKNCPYCGSPQRDEAVECRSCGKSFVAPPPAVPVPPKILFVSRFLLWLIAWILAALFMAIDAHEYWRSAGQFTVLSPPGFITAVFTHPSMNSPEWNLCVALGWIYYALLTLFGFTTRKYRVFFWLFFTLCLSLTLNCVLWIVALYFVMHK